MSLKTYTIENIGDITVYKRKDAKKISLKVVSGSVRVTQPAWLPYRAGIVFAEKNQPWIKKQLAKDSLYCLQNSIKIGKNYTLNFIQSDKMRSYVRYNDIDVYYMQNQEILSDDIQLLAKKAIKRALMSETKELLPERIQHMANTYDYKYGSIKIKPMKSRWGSCDSNKDITINCYLIHMPWEVIDYVILHELTHTVHMHHGSEFWTAIQKNMPDYKERRKILKNMQLEVSNMQI